MEENVAQQLQARLAQLPEDVRAAVLSVEWEAKVQAIGAKHQLHIDQIGALGDTTLMAMLGMFDIAEYPAKVGEELKVAPDLAAAIAKEVSDEVFTSIRDSLHTLSQQKPAPAAFPAMAAAPAVPAPATPTAMPAVPASPKPDLAAADAMLSKSIVSTPAPATPAPTPAASTQPEAPKPTYSADPYREPPV